MSKPSDSFPVPLLSPRQVFVVDIRPSSSDLTALGTCLSSGSQRQRLVSVQTFFSLSLIHLGEFIPLAQSMHRSGSYSLKTFSYTHSLSIVILYHCGPICWKVSRNTSRIKKRKKSETYPVCCRCSLSSNQSRLSPSQLAVDNSWTVPA